MRKTDYDLFLERFNPPLDLQGSLIRKEKNEVVHDISNPCLWTMIECGTSANKWYISPGYHYVNALFYIITEKPWDGRTTKSGAIRDYLY